MRLSYNWLKDYVSINMPAEKLAVLLTMAGLGVEWIQKAGDDYLLELEITANRPDWLSMTGIAREVASLTGKKLKLPPAKNRARKVARTSKSAISVKVEDKKLCPRYTAKIIRNVRIGESPGWLKDRLEEMGLRSVNNIVDITNFCLFETGEPMHAFDLDKIIGNEVIVRNARQGEKITTIDDIERPLRGGDLVIADSAKAIAIAGVMGGLDTEVTASTKDILLEAAYFDPISVRRTSRALGISTESSYRFERRVDIANIACASDRATALIIEVAGGEPGEFIDVGTKAIPPRTIVLRYERMNEIIGLDIRGPVAKKILNSLGLKTRASFKEKAEFLVPTFRYDLHDEIDLIEEVARVYGYEKVPLTIPGIVEQFPKIGLEMVVADRIRTCLAAMGIDEIITYSLMSRKSIEGAGIADERVIDVKNPLTSEQESMRPSLMIGMLNSILWNINRKTKDLRLFELGNVYHKNSADTFSEKKHLSIGITGQASSGWITGSMESSFFDLKGIVEALLAELGITDARFEFAKDASYDSGECAYINIGEERIGILGEVKGAVLAAFDIKEKVYAAELEVDMLMKFVTLEKHLKELPRYPSVYRDISLVVNKGVLNAELVSLVRRTGGDVLKDIKLIDRYTGKQIPDGKESLTYRLEYQKSAKTLEEKEVTELHNRILTALEEKFGAKLR